MGDTSLRCLATIFALAWLSAGPVPEARAQGGPLSGWGIVVLHGKGGRPTGATSSLNAALVEAGARVAAPVMAWSGSKGRPDKYEMTYEQALAQIAASIVRLKQQGAARIAVAGHSLGANAAIGLAARNGAGLAAVIALAPGHTPERMGRTELVDGLARARQLISAGKGDAMTRLPDINAGRTFQVPSTPRAYVSFFDGAGAAVIPKNVAAMPALPLLWIVGRRDPLASLGRGYAFDLAKPHARSRYAEVDAGHLDTPEAARQVVIDWLESL